MDTKKIFRCKHCGNIISMIYSSGVKVVCCGEEMNELIPNTMDAALEKHVPVINMEGHVINVKIGEVDHPMIDEHYIEWIYLETKEGSQLKYLTPGEMPLALFTIIDDEPLVAYAYCNLHGLWKKEIK